MSEYRQKLDGFVWPTYLPDNIRYLARDIKALDDDHGLWFGYSGKPECHHGNWSDERMSTLSIFGVEVDDRDLPVGDAPLLLCRDDYMSPTKRSATFHGVNSGDGESFLWGEVPHDEVRAICGEFANPVQDHLGPVEILYHLGAMDGKRRKITITVEDVA